MNDWNMLRKIDKNNAPVCELKGSSGDFDQDNCNCCYYLDYYD